MAPNHTTHSEGRKRFDDTTEAIRRVQKMHCSVTVQSGYTYRDPPPPAKWQDPTGYDRQERDHGPTCPRAIRRDNAAGVRDRRWARRLIVDALNTEQGTGECGESTIRPEPWPRAATISDPTLKLVAHHIRVQVATACRAIRFDRSRRVAVAIRGPRCRVARRACPFWRQLAGCTVRRARRSGHVRRVARVSCESARRTQAGDL